MDILNKLEEIQANRVRLAVCDIDGVLRGKFIHYDKFKKIIRDDSGFGFCNVIFGWDILDQTYGNDDGTGFSGWHTGYPDDRAIVDVDTFRTIPWLQNTPFFLADLPDAYVCPRSLLKRISSQADQMGYVAKFAQEFEFFQFRESGKSLRDKNFQNLNTLTSGMFGYSLLKTTENHEYSNLLFDFLNKFDIPIEGLHTETGPGVYEACIQYSDVVEAGDRAVLFKTAVKEIASLYEIVPSFMAKWNAGLPGCGGHLHQSLWDKKGNNVFADSAMGSAEGVSEVMGHYIAGALHCMPYLMPIYAPNVNSYKRLCGGDWAPNRASWGVENRTAGLRVINMALEDTRLENRVPGADVNPYIVMAASLASGLYGIRNKLPLPEPVNGDAYSSDTALLPRNLGDAIKLWKDSTLPEELLGKKFADHFIRTREWEWSQYEKSVGTWELERYLEII